MTHLDKTALSDIDLGDVQQVKHYLGCTQNRSDATLPDGSPIVKMTYDMRMFVSQCRSRYLSLAPPDTTLKKVLTPFRKKRDGGGPFRDAQVDNSGNEIPEAPVGALSEHCARVVMKVLYAARLARPDILRAVNGLARHLMKWTQEQDDDLNQLMSYLLCSQDKLFTGWVGDHFDDIAPYLFTDADYAGCTESQKSTSGIFLTLKGPRTSFPIGFRSKRQTAASTSTTESELLAAYTGAKDMGVPCISLLAKVWQLYHSCFRVYYPV